MSDIFDERRKALEEEYFHRKEQEALKKMREQMAQEKQAQEDEASALHCPKCAGILKEMTFAGVSIDRCEACGGVWLDAGEIERLKNEGGWLTKLFGNQANK